MKKVIILLFAALLAAGSVDAKQKKSYYRTMVRCLGVELDGSQTLRVTGNGRNRADAREQAMKNAVYTVLFEGVKNGTGGCNTRPIVEDLRLKSQYEDFFNAFFADNGPYTRFVSLKDTKTLSGGKERTKVGYNYELTVRVLSADLKRELKANSILK